MTGRLTSAPGQRQTSESRGPNGGTAEWWDDGDVSELTIKHSSAANAATSVSEEGP
jgi:hypothetical protein